ncbi:hypothetical protein J1605_018741 [Eschrichtius robustus]|uniref:Uncharacterized protein n=1 Tax=Eschrichtius robustus TaxID=9764 RepID=A0AB34HVD5_ESCRO|nr:hypothetical protein J1605_018741 [Eschrichtius robustus]
MRGEPVAAEAGMTLHQPEARRAFSRGSCPRITGPWQWRAAQAPGRGGVESDLCSHTGFLAVFTPPTPVLSLRSEGSPSLSSQPPPAPAAEQTSLSGCLRP